MKAQLRKRLVSPTQIRIGKKGANIFNNAEDVELKGKFNYRR